MASDEPLAEPDEAERWSGAMSDALDRAPPHLRIALVDQHAFFRRGMREVINEEEDMEVVAEAADGELAVQLARDLRPHGLNLVLMEIDLPRLDGITATEWITAADPELPVVMLTASTLDRDLFEAVRAGAVGFLSKSLSPQALVRALRGFHQGESLPMSPRMAQKVLAYLQQPAAARELAADQLRTALSAREREVLKLIAGGARDREIADLLVVRKSTVKKHVQNILRKLHARNRTEAAARLRGTELDLPSLPGF